MRDLRHQPVEARFFQNLFAYLSVTLSYTGHSLSFGHYCSKGQVQKGCVRLLFLELWSLADKNFGCQSLGRYFRSDSRRLRSHPGAKADLSAPFKKAFRSASLAVTDFKHAFPFAFKPWRFSCGYQELVRSMWPKGSHCLLPVVF